MTFDSSAAPLDPRHDEPVSYLGRMVTAQPVKLITAELKRWENMPSRREPLTIGMTMTLSTKPINSQLTTGFGLCMSGAA
jgi:hypothetical protein